MKFRRATVALLASFLLAGTAAADQNDPRLDALFERLQTVENEAVAAQVTRRIWQIWRDSGNALVDAIMQRGSQALVANRLVRAERHFDQVVQMAPDYAEGWNQRATVRYLRGNFAASAADIRRTLLLEPRHFGALAGLGLVYMEVGRNAAALDAFRRALAVNPHLAGARANIELLERRMGEGNA